MQKLSSKLRIGCAIFLSAMIGSPQFDSRGAFVVQGGSTAWADDDGDDDGDSGSGANRSSSAGGNSGFIKKRNSVRRSALQKRKQARRNVNRKATAVASRSAAPNELVIRNVTEQDLAELTNRGYNLVARSRGFENKFTVKLSIPSKRSLRRARNEARQLLPSATIEFNHYYRHGYRVQTGGGCKADGCKPFEIVKWTATVQNCKITPDIGIIDTAIDFSHPVLQGSTATELKTDTKAASFKDNSHGTAVAALLAGRAESAAPGLIPRGNLKTIDVFEMGRSNDLRTDAYALADALETMGRENVLLVNLSVAGPKNDVLNDVVQQYWKAGGLLVAAAGNFGPSAPPAYPAAFDNVIAVSAVSDNLELYKRSNRGAHIDLAAPGVNIRSAGRKADVENFSGTSFAAPFVTAAVAILLSNGKNNTDVVAALNTSAKDLGKPGPDVKFGAGLVQFIEMCDTSR